MSRDEAVLLDMINAAQKIPEYDDVDLEETWNTADRDVPALIAELRRLSGAEEQG